MSLLVEVFLKAVLIIVVLVLLACLVAATNNARAETNDQALCSCIERLVISTDEARLRGVTREVALAQTNDLDTAAREIGLTVIEFVYTNAGQFDRAYVIELIHTECKNNRVRVIS